MIRLIQWLVWGHVHEWEFVEKVKVGCNGQYSADDYILRCKTCGNFKKRRL